MPSVRISSRKQYNGGLFILDLNRAPWGCSMFIPFPSLKDSSKCCLGVWPAFWTVGDNWPKVRLLFMCSSQAI
jgi:hypothetical protein